MALPNKEQYIPTKTIYILRSPMQFDRTGKPLKDWFKHGVGFNAEGRGSTTSYNDAQFLIKKFGCKDITKKHWSAKAKEWEKLEKADKAEKGKPKTETESKTEDEAKPEKS